MQSSRQILCYFCCLALLLVLPALPSYLLGMWPSAGDAPGLMVPFLSMTILSVSRWLASLIVLGFVLVGERTQNLSVSRWVTLCFLAVLLYSGINWFGYAAPIQAPLTFDDWVVLGDWLVIVIMMDLMTLHGLMAGVLCAVTLGVLRSRKVISPRYGTTRVVL